MANGAADYKNVTENTLLRIVDDQYDLIQIVSRCPACFQAYRDLIHKKRAGLLKGVLPINRQGNGLTGSNSQQEEGWLIGNTGTTSR
jgi:hypothetical protein